jgi:hypothetical protein
VTLAFRSILIGSALALAWSWGSRAMAGPTLYTDPQSPDSEFVDPDAYDDDESSAPQVSWSTTYASRYSFQGFDYSNGHPVLQPEVTGTMGAVSMNLWGNLDQVQGVVTEVDATVQAGWTVQAVTVGVGYANLQYPNRIDRSFSQELFSQIAAELPLNPNAELHWDIDAAHGLYGSVGLGAERSFGGVTCGLGSHLYAQHKYYGMTGISGLETSIGSGISWRGIAWQGELARLWTWENGDFRNLQSIAGGWLFRLTLSSL